MDMALWWIGNALLLVAVIPVVILLLNRLLRPALEIKKYADDILDNGVRLTGQLDAVPQLLKTRDLVREAAGHAARYAAAVDDVL